MHARCPVCSHDEINKQLCVSCGCDIGKEALTKVNKNRVLLKGRYSLAYGRLQSLLRNPKAELENNPDLQRFVRSPSDLEILKKLPSPEEIEPIDIICLADSISRGRLESFFQLQCPGHSCLGQYVREQILSPFGHESLRDHFTLIDLYVPEILRNQ